MPEKFNNKYRIPSARKSDWNYSRTGAYFITICCDNHINYFGKITNGQMHYSSIGRAAELEWRKTLLLRPDMHLKLGAFVVMPNHFHAIISIDDNAYNTIPDDVHLIHGYHNNQFAPQSKNLASILRGFKSAVTTMARITNQTFAWQPRYHDHIIRDDAEYTRIENYINNNIAKWGDDKFHK